MALGLALVPLAHREARAERVPLTVKLPDKGFEQIARKKGVVVYKHKESDIIRLGAEGRMPASPEEVRAVLLDYEAQRGRITIEFTSVEQLRSLRDHVLGARPHGHGIHVRVRA